MNCILAMMEKFWNFLAMLKPESLLVLHKEVFTRPNEKLSCNKFLRQIETFTYDKFGA